MRNNDALVAPHLPTSDLMATIVPAVGRGIVALAIIMINHHFNVEERFANIVL